MKKVITFIGHITPYAKGDVAGFDKEVAEKYIEDGFAVEYKEAKKEVKKEEEKKETSKKK